MPCAASSCSPLLMAAKVDKAVETKVIPRQKAGHGMGTGGVAAIFLGVAFVVLSSMGVFYVLNTRPAANPMANRPHCST
ncbi:Plasma membrane intrinsic protein 2,4 [Hibiscus syriacus]|uniref:Plasma membrane intrinsic protein 2,4 n=1 Tax=Hibiscus syriacus TaxID=106335 RepID=A0A6A2ZHS9_HIBSY|nr:Plasma membrane intrinsic protein 2,4 [Hibiscus syriacus]